MAQNLTFTADGDFYVSEISGGGNACVAFQLNYEDDGASVIVEFAVDPAMGWETASTNKAGETYADVISGAQEGIKVRIRTDRMPISAKYEQL